MKRHRELLEPELVWSPVRPIGGFICVDFHVGCSGCAFCLNRRQPEWRAVLDRGLQLDLSSCGVSPEDLFQLVSSLPSFRRGRVPVRCGHLTDLRHQNRGTEALFNLLPPDYPCVAMTRYPLSTRQSSWIRGQPNLLVHVSLSPCIPRCEKDHVPPPQIIDSTRGLPVENLFFMCRPLVDGHEPAARAVVEALPAGCAVGFHGLNTDSIPGMSGLSALSTAAIADLRSLALERGLRVFDFFGCVLWARLGRPFFRYVEASQQPGTACSVCPNARVCADPGPPVEESRVHVELARLLIEVEALELRGRTVAVRTPTPASRAEEVYLSEILSAKVSLSSVTRADAPGLRVLGPEVLRRWEASGFVPVARLRELSLLVKAGLGL